MNHCYSVLYCRFFLWVRNYKMINLHTGWGRGYIRILLTKTTYTVSLHCLQEPESREPSHTLPRPRQTILSLRYHLSSQLACLTTPSTIIKFRRRQTTTALQPHLTKPLSSRPVSATVSASRCGRQESWRRRKNSSKQLSLYWSPATTSIETGRLLRYTRLHNMRCKEYLLVSRRKSLSNLMAINIILA